MYGETSLPGVGELLLPGNEYTLYFNIQPVCLYKGFITLVSM
jgi:hypothetical protein